MAADLHRGARTGDLELVRFQIGKGTDVNSKFAKDLWTPLLWAAHNGHDSVVQLLVDSGAQINTQSKKGTTALHWAIQNKHYNTAHLLLNLGASINITDKDSWTALHWASHNGSKSLVEEIIRRGAYVDARSRSNSTALHWACENGHDEVALLLIENGANPTAVNASGKTPADLLSGANQLGIGLGNHANQALRKFLIEASSSSSSSSSALSSNGISLSPPSSLENSEDISSATADSDFCSPLGGSPQPITTLSTPRFEGQRSSSTPPPLVSTASGSSSVLPTSTSSSNNSSSASLLLNASAQSVMQSQNDYIELLKGTIGKLVKRLDAEKRVNDELQLKQREMQTQFRREIHEQNRQIEGQREVILEQEEKLSRMSRHHAVAAATTNTLTCPIDMEPYQASGDRRPCICKSCGKSLCVGCYNRISNSKCPFCNALIKAATGACGGGGPAPLINRDLVDLLEAHHQHRNAAELALQEENSDDF